MKTYTQKEVEEMLEGISPYPWRVEQEGADRFICNKDDERFCSDEIFSIRIPKTMKLIAAATDLARQLLECMEENDRLKEEGRVIKDAISLLGVLRRIEE